MPHAKQIIVNLNRIYRRAISVTEQSMRTKSCILIKPRFHWRHKHEPKTTHYFSTRDIKDKLRKKNFLFNFFFCSCIIFKIFNILIFNISDGCVVALLCFLFCFSLCLWRQRRPGLTFIYFILRLRAN